MNEHSSYPSNRWISNVIRVGLSLLFFIILQIPAKRAYAIDLQPGEVRAPKPGVNRFQLSYQYSERGSRYLHGQKQPGNPEILSSQFLMRAGRSFEVLGYPGMFYVQSSMGYLDPKGSLAQFNGDSGVGDTAFALAIWPYASHATQTYFGIGAYWIVPTGSYSRDRSFNMGENRYRSALQVGFQTALLGQLHWMAALDGVRFEKNSDFGPRSADLEQRMLYTGQTGLRYDIHPNFSVAATYYYTQGGETRLNGISRDDETRLHRYQLSGIAKFSFGQLTLQYGGDLKTENGFIEDHRLIFRYTKLF